LDFPPAAAPVKCGPEKKEPPMTKLNIFPAGSTDHILNFPGRHLRRSPRVPAPAPSLRVPATRENRERLRKLREAELEAWLPASPNAALRAEVQNALNSQRNESWLIAGVAVIAIVALMIGTTSSVDFVGNWKQFVSLVQMLLG